MTLKERVDEVPYWYHRIVLPDGVKTYGETCGSASPGWAPIEPVMYRVPMDLTGLRILDVGAWDGYWTWEALKRGAKEVVAIDDFSDIRNFRAPEKWLPWHTFDLCKDAFSYGDDVCSRHELSVYNVTEERLGRFDAVFFFGVIYHCRHPLLALERLASVCDGDIYVESAVSDLWSPYTELNKGRGEDMVMEFFPSNEYADNETNWWVPTLKALTYMVASSGPWQSYGWMLTQEPKHIAHLRGFVKGERKADA